jgi:hypothetical protein
MLKKVIYVYSSGRWTKGDPDVASASTALRRMKVGSKVMVTLRNPQFIDRPVEEVDDDAEATNERFSCCCYCWKLVAAIFFWLKALTLRRRCCSLLLCHEDYAVVLSKA